ncbi:exopolysaccharide biosynthesis GT4 family glycosyltransferase EpsE [Paracoccus shandongensis]|uniref:exopolysaccharide biosynthesis GT4 family glycosyltransferase EpsE n=1 Tax=Paracoccus shandongensis TaxID=2816048 RepID=UPI001A8D461D|nr:exopolysaccharide biosynthesis GT4 family glycosyltransferase EpsE [Paracoccus shandongensis]
MSLPARIAVLIPEFPGQTHSFFWREIEALALHHGIGSQIVSTRLAPKPVWHDWVEQAAAIQLYPLPRGEVARLLPDLALALPRLAADPDIRRILRRPKAWAFVLMALRLARICKARGLAHLHVHSCANFALIAALCHRISGIPYSLVLHGPLRDYGPDQPFKWKGAAFVFVITETLRAEVATAMPQVMDKVRVVPMGVNTDLFTPPAAPRPDAPHIFTWFCCARLNRVKGHDTLIEAARLLRAARPDLPFRIRIAGEDEQGGTGYRRDLEAMIAAAGLPDAVTLLGSVTQDAVRAELQSADSFVLASRHEPLGVAYMEAMACQLPVIGTDAGGVRELITEGRDGLLVPPDDAEALAAAMARMMEDRDLRRSLGRAARQRILADFSSRRSADALAVALAGDRP